MTLEDYLLICLAEECAEVQHAVSKALRFGLDYDWPGRPGVTNRTAIREELRDVLALMRRLNLTPNGLPDKGDKFERMLAVSRAQGRLAR